MVLKVTHFKENQDSDTRKKMLKEQQKAMNSMLIPSGDMMCNSWDSVTFSGRREVVDDVRNDNMRHLPSLRNAS